MKTRRIADFSQQVLPFVEEELDRTLPPEFEPPGRLHEAMRYSVFAGGKRLRPLLCIAGYRTFRPDWKRVLPIAACLELVHTYSLIHDDLPAMDDDDYRRGMPSCHKKFGEALAILTGDALLTLAFETIAASSDFPPDRILAVLTRLSRAAGTRNGMISGQVLDLEATARDFGVEQLESIHRAKTGALLEAAVVIGASLAEVGPDELTRIQTYGDKLGLAFQIVDDILDETGKGATLGKTPGKDREQSKATYPKLYGLEESRRLLGEITSEAREGVSMLGESAELLIEMADYLENRSN